MRISIFLIFLYVSSQVIGQKEQNREVKLTTKIGYGLYADLLINSPSIDLGVNFSNKNGDSYVYLGYDFKRNSSYNGHYLGLTIEHHFLNEQKRFRPYVGLSLMSEVTSNYKEGLTYDSTFRINQAPANYPVYIGGNSSYYMFHASGFYYSTPLFGTASIGFDLRLIKDLHLSFSLGYGLQLMRYKYLEWKNDEDYREMLKDIPMETRMLHYVNAELGLRYEFSYNKER